VDTGDGAGSKVILIAEDEESLRELVRVSLGNDYSYVECVDGAEAIAQLESNPPPDLVVLDLMLPRRSGVDVLAALRGDPAIRDTPVVVISAWTHAEDTAVQAGADRFVAKPFDPDELKTIVDGLLETR
jgi:CheY-like chemotaxis protein